MADPTQALRDKVLSFVPGAAGQSFAAAKAKRDEQLAADEANNLVMQREPTQLPLEALNVVNPDIPITPQLTQSPALSQAAIAPISASLPVAPIQEREVAFEPGDKLLSDLDRHQKMAEDRHIKKEDDRIKRMGEIESRIAEIEKTPFKFDNSSMWEKSSTGQKIALFIGGALSSLSPQSAQSFQSGVQNAIKADLDLQKAKFDEFKDTKNSLYSQLHKELGNQESAGLAWESIAYKGISDKLAYQRDIARSSAQKEAADRSYTIALSESLIKRDLAIKAANTETAKKSIIGYDGTIPDATQKRNFEDATVAGSSMREQLQKLRTITAQTGKSFNPKARAEAQSAIGLIISDYKTFKKLGTLDKGVENLFEKLVQNPTDFFSLDSSSLAKINSFDKSITSEMDRTAKSHGLKPTGINSYVRKAN